MAIINIDNALESNGLKIIFNYPFFIGDSLSNSINYLLNYKISSTILKKGYVQCL
jgi:hypothetical protein